MPGRRGRVIEEFNEALAELKANGTYDEIMNKYFTYDVKL